MNSFSRLMLHHSRIHLSALLLVLFVLVYVNIVLDFVHTKEFHWSVDTVQKKQQRENPMPLDKCSWADRYNHQCKSLLHLGAKLDKQHPIFDYCEAAGASKEARLFDDALAISKKFCMDAMMEEGDHEAPIDYDVEFYKHRILVSATNLESREVGLYHSPRAALLGQECGTTPHLECNISIHYNPLFDGEYGLFLITALPFVYFAERCGFLLQVPLRVCFSHQSSILYFHKPGVVEGNVEMVENFNITSFNNKIPVAYVHSTLCTDPLRPIYDRRHFGATSHSESPHSVVPRNAWLPPPLQVHYLKAKRLPSLNLFESLPIVLVSNKFASEWHGEAVNYFDVEMLSYVFKKLLDAGYAVIYIRLGGNEQSESFVGDDQRLSRDKRLDDVELINQLHDSNPLYEQRLVHIYTLQKQTNLSLNELQLRAMSRVTCTISVQGGNSYLASYFGWNGIIYHIRGREDYEYKGLLSSLSGQQQVVCRSRAEFYHAFDDLFLNDSIRPCWCTPKL